MKDAENPDFAAALEAGLKLIVSRDRSESEIRTGLEKLGFSLSAIQAAMDRLKARRMLDDARLAQTRAAQKSAKGLGIELVRRDLERLGIDSESIEKATGEIAIDQSQLAKDALRERLSKRPSTTMAQAWRFLASRGFSEEDVDRAVQDGFGATDHFAE